VDQTVIIPCRNEEKTIGPIVEVFRQEQCRVWVIIDAETTDNTNSKAQKAGALTIHSGLHGKGENVSFAVNTIPNLSERIILCDGDYTGLTVNHIQRLISYPDNEIRPDMAVGLPDYPLAVPKHVTRSWPYVSGFRYLRWWWIPINGHGYLLETQINQAVHNAKGLVRYTNMPGLHSPFQWPLSARRMAALQADRAWGKTNGIL
jgi:glycosyltransferase involved in cell wall biosynthesis